jgi:RNA methyltransferase, TrmH family
MSRSELAIQSESNERFKTWAELSHSRGIRKYQQFFLSGEKLIKEFLCKRTKYKVLAEIMTRGHESCMDDAPETRSHTNRLVDENFRRYRLSEGLFQQLDVLGTHFNLLLLTMENLEEADMGKAPQSLELVCPLGDPGNLGAIMRSSMAFGVNTMVLTEEACNPFLPKVIKSSAGSALELNLKRTEKLSELSIQPWDFFLDKGGEGVAKFPWPKNLRLWVGEEGQGWKGLKEQPSLTQTLSVEMQSVESLNAVVATSIALYRWNLLQAPFGKRGRYRG